MIQNDVANTTKANLKGAAGGKKQAPTGNNFSRDMRREMLKQILVDRMAKK
jgi:hypothetical protein